jgi:excisionase family DNA binding protein
VDLARDPPQHSQFQISNGATVEANEAGGKDILTVEEAAELAGCNARTMKQLLRDGILPGTKLGRYWKVPRAELVSELGKLAALNVALRRETELLKELNAWLKSQGLGEVPS